MWLAVASTLIANGMATAADWMSAASFISMAGIIAFMGYDGTVYLMGWTGGYVILGFATCALFAQIRRVHRAGLYWLALLLDYRSRGCRDLSDFNFLYLCCRTDAWRRHCVLAVSEHSDFLGCGNGMAIVFMYAVLGGMKGITYTQSRAILRADFRLPGACHFHFDVDHRYSDSANWSGAEVADGSGLSVLQKLDNTLVELGFAPYTKAASKARSMFSP